MQRTFSRSAASCPARCRPRRNSTFQGKIDQWYSLQGRPGVVFILNVTDPAMAKVMLEALPLRHERLMSFELVPLGPLTPLRQLLPAHPQ